MESMYDVRVIRRWVCPGCAQRHVSKAEYVLGIEDVKKIQASAEQVSTPEDTIIVSVLPCDERSYQILPDTSRAM